MSTISVFALGGLGENGKNMYCVEVDQTLFILDAGLKYPSVELFGVDSIIPDFNYLEEHKDQIEGLFLSHGHEDHIGAVPKLLKTIDIPVYASNFTLAILKDTMTNQGMDVSQYTFHTVSSDKTLQFDQAEVDFYRLTHSIPESLGVAITTKDGVIVYAPDYNFDQNVNSVYQTEFAKLAQIASKGVLALLTESLGAEHVGYTHSSKRLDYALNQAFYQAEGRIIVSTFSTDLVRIQKIIDVALEYNRDIAIIGRKTQRTVDLAVNLGYLKIPEGKLLQLRFIDDTNKNELKNAVVLVTGDRHEPFYMLQRMVKKQDRLIHIEPSDTILSMTPPIPGTEKIAARTLDILYRHDTNVVTIGKSILPPAHASSEDVKLMINILQPKYVVPVIGEYRHQFAMRELIQELGYTDDQIILLDNGQIVRFINTEKQEQMSNITSGDILVDGILDGDVNDVVLRDRELMAQDGVLLIIANIDVRKKTVVTDPEVVSRGFVFMKENEELIEEVQEIFMTVSKQQLQGKYVEWRDYKKAVRDEVSRYLYKVTKRRPIVIPVLIDSTKK